MSSRADEFRKRMKKRKRERSRETEKWRQQMTLPEDEERYGFERISSYESNQPEDPHPLFNKEKFLFKMLAAACLFLFVAIIFRNEASSLDPARSFVKKSLDEDFQFAAVSEWYETKFGKPLALLPVKNTTEKVQTDPPHEQQYALPASGTIVENFETNGQGIMVETGKNAEVEAITEGLVSFAGIKDDHGKTVIIQHADQTETWYGNLDEIHVNLFDFIPQGKVVGTVSEGSDETKGAFYFAIKQGKDFIDPIQVIQFE